jgi:hypothetical protein
MLSDRPSLIEHIYYTPPPGDIGSKSLQFSGNLLTGPRHHVGFGAEDIADAILDANQFDQIKACVVSIEEQIDITVRPGRLADNGAEQIEPGDRLPRLTRASA